MIDNKISFPNYDISFCASDCIDVTCSRCMESINYKKALEATTNGANPYMTFMTGECASYQKPLTVFKRSRI